MADLKVIWMCHWLQILHSSLRGSGSDKGGLARVMVGRAAIDMDEILRVFRKKYGMELREAICESLPSGDIRDFLLALASNTTTAITSTTE